MTHEPNSRRVSRNQSALSILLTHCGASTSPPQPNQHEHQHQHAPPSCPACLPASLPTFPAPSQPARQPSFLGLNKSRKCQTAGALTLHERANAPRRCLHTSIVSDGGLSVLLSIHPQALHGITDDSNIARDDGPSRGDIHHSARSNTRTHRLRPPPASPQQNLHHPMLPPEHWCQDLVHNNKPTACRYGEQAQKSLAFPSEQGSEEVWVWLFATHHSTGRETCCCE